MTSNHHAPYGLGYTRATMDGAEGGEAARRSGAQKPVHSSDCSLQSELGPAFLGLLHLAVSLLFVPAIVARV